jgi:hypothetical protein
MFRIIRDPNDYFSTATSDEIAKALPHARLGRFIVEEVSPAVEFGRHFSIRSMK